MQTFLTIGIRLQTSMNTCMYVDMNTCMYVDMNTCMYVDMNTCMYVDMNTCMYADIPHNRNSIADKHDVETSIHTHIHTCIDLYINRLSQA